MARGKDQMGFFSEIRKRYSDLLAGSISSYKDYLSIEREILTAMVGIGASIALALIVGLLLRVPYSAEMAILTGVAGSIASLGKILERISRSLERARGLAEELPYLVFMASAVGRTGLELIEAMQFVSASETSVFKYFRSLSRRIISASKYIGIDSAVEGLAGIPRGIKKVLLTYLSSISMGIGVETLGTLSLEMIRDASKQASRTIDLAAQAGLVLIMILTTAPILILGISSILGSHIALSTGVLIGVFAPLAVLSLPQVPLPLRIVVGDSGRRFFLIISIASIGLMAATFVLIYTAALSIIHVGVVKGYIAWLSIAMIALGSIWLMVFVNYLSGIKRAKEILISVSSYVKAYRTLGSYDLDREARKTGPYSPWILHYIFFAIGFFREKGEMEPAIFTRFSEEILDIVAKNTSRLVGSLLPLAASLAQPIILAQMIPMLGSMTHGVGMLTILLTSIVASSLVASKIFFGTARNTLAMGVSLLTLYMLLLR